MSSRKDNCTVNETHTRQVIMYKETICVTNSHGKVCVSVSPSLGLLNTKMTVCVCMCVCVCVCVYNSPTVLRVMCWTRDCQTLPSWRELGAHTPILLLKEVTNCLINSSFLFALSEAQTSACRVTGQDFTSELVNSVCVCVCVCVIHHGHEDHALDS